MSEKRFRKNDQIRLSEIFLIDEKGEKIGVISTTKAKEMALQRALDLVEVSPNSRPPVCRIMDFGTFLYEQRKKEKSQKKAKKTETKGIRFGIRISDHDLETKIRSSKKFLEKGHSLKVTLIFRGREIAHEELGFEKMRTFGKALEGWSRIDQTPKKQGRQIIMTLLPEKNLKKISEEE